MDYRIRAGSYKVRVVVALINEHVRIDGVVPGVRGQRAFPQAALPGCDPFIMLDQIGPQRVERSTVIDGAPHPHRGFETVSIFLAGGMEHVDSIGNRLPLGAGDIQVMNAGRGIIHGGKLHPDRETGEFHEFQLWVNLPAASKMTTPVVHNVASAEIPVFEQPVLQIRVLTGELLGVVAEAQTTQPTSIGHAYVNPHVRVPELSVPADYRALVYVIRGGVQAGEHSARAYDTLDFGVSPQPLQLTAGDQGAELLVLTGLVIDEPVVIGGPFVMNNEAEIETAFGDYHAGRFGSVP